MPPRILFVADDPLTTSFGHGQRLIAIRNGLASIGDLTSVLITWSDDKHIDGGYDAVVRTPRPRGVEKLTRWLRSDLPQNAIFRDPSELRDEIAGHLEDSYDLIWFNRLRTHVIANGLAAGPTIVDYDDLYDRYIESAKHDPYFTASWRQRLADVALSRVDAKRWSVLQRTHAAMVDRVVLCSPEDVDHLGCSNAVAIGNGCLEPESLEIRHDNQPPTLLFVGPLDYSPNLAAARLLAREVLPLVRNTIPDAQLRLIGRSPVCADDLVALPGVSAPGFVEDLADEYHNATVAMTPLRSGAGSCIKTIEAMAHGVPQVSTPFGVRGFEVQHGVHVLIGDTGEELAEHVMRIISDAGLARRLSDESRRWFLANGTWNNVSGQVADLARGLLEDRPAQS